MERAGPGTGNESYYKGSDESGKGYHERIEECGPVRECK